MPFAHCLLTIQGVVQKVSLHRSPTNQPGAVWCHLQPIPALGVFPLFCLTVVRLGAFLSAKRRAVILNISLSLKVTMKLIRVACNTVAAAGENALKPSRTNSHSSLLQID